MAQDLFKIVKAKASENKLRKVTKVKIKVGVAAGVEEDFLRHSFLDHILPGTIAEGAKLEIVEEPLEARCKNCEERIAAEAELSLSCPACSSLNVEITKGKGVYLESIEGDA